MKSPSFPPIIEEHTHTDFSFRWGNVDCEIKSGKLFITGSRAISNRSDASGSLFLDLTKDDPEEFVNTLNKMIMRWKATLE